MKPLAVLLRGWCAGALAGAASGFAVAAWIVVAAWIDAGSLTTGSEPPFADAVAVLVLGSAVGVVVGIVVGLVAAVAVALLSPVVRQTWQARVVGAAAATVGATVLVTGLNADLASYLLVFAPGCAVIGALVGRVVVFGAGRPR